MSPVLNNIASLVGDEDAAVRKAFNSFLSWYLSRLSSVRTEKFLEIFIFSVAEFTSQESLRPFHNLLIFFTTSALSSVSPQVRLDAVKTLDILHEIGVRGEEGRVFESYLSLLQVKGGQASSQLSPAVNTPHCFFGGL
jgi:hypothetical protein